MLEDLFMNKCGKIKRMFSRYADGEASDSEKALIIEHIKNCDECSRELAGIVRVKDLVVSKRKLAVNENLILSRIHYEIELRFDEANKFSLEKMENLSHRFIPVPIAMFVVSLFLLFFVSTGKVRSDFPLIDDIFSGVPASNETALGLVLGIED
ncbi:MAG: anti-sigma factor [Candidatus Omnitrophica bacterium]|nr:anti-sigma factor [Candidatus Omnitrophota bacterium]MDD5081103.1 anti-sigma factor [Candidatus Omnitrophota bacterium]